MKPQPSANFRRPQISLSWLIAGLLLLGPVLGFGAPLALRALRQWQTPRAVPAVPIAPAKFDAAPADYYESAETPLD